MEVNYKALDVLCQVPKYGSAGAAGADLYAATSYDIIIEPGQTVKIGTGLAMELPEGTAGLILPRSGLASKKGLAPINTPGLIDCDYRGEFIVALHNHSDIPQKIEAGERIAQLMIIPYIRCDFNRVDELDTTKRGEGGFGSTGTK